MTSCIKHLLDNQARSLNMSSKSLMLLKLLLKKIKSKVTFRLNFSSKRYTFCLIRIWYVRCLPGNVRCTQGYVRCTQGMLGVLWGMLGVLRGMLGLPRGMLGVPRVC